MKVLITGIQGFVGRRLAQALMQKGHEVSGLSRRPGEGLWLQRIHRVELGQDAPVGSFAGVDLVVHAAHDRQPGSMERNVEGTWRWALQARGEGARQQLFLTSVSAHPAAPSEYGRVKAALEARFRSIGALQLRPGLVVGDGGSFGDLARMIKRSPIVPVMGGDQVRVALTEIDSILETLLRWESLKGSEPYNIFGAQWVGLGTLARAIKAQCASRTLLVPVPLALATGLLTLGQALGLPKTLGPENLRSLRLSQGYGYASSYAELGLREKSLEELLVAVFPR